MEENFEFVVKYSYDRRNSRGTIDNTGTEVSICDATEGYNFAMQIRHENHLFCHVIDGTNDFALHEYSGTSLEEHIQELKNKKGKEKREPVMEYVPIPEVLPYDGCLGLNYLYVPSPFRKIIRDMLSFVCHIHSKRYSLAVKTLSLKNNLLVKDSTLKFFNVAFKIADPGTKAADYLRIQEVLAKIFVGYRRLPPDMLHLGRRLREFTNFVPKNEKSILNHFALLSHSQRIARIRGFKEVEGRLVEKRSNRLNSLVQSLNYKAVGWTQTVMYYPVNICLCYEILKRKDLDNMDLISARELAVHYDDFIDKIDCAAGRLRFCRNLASHLASHLKKCENVDCDTDLEMDCMIMRVCGDFLLEVNDIIPGDIMDVIASHFA